MKTVVPTGSLPPVWPWKQRQPHTQYNGWPPTVDTEINHATILTDSAKLLQKVEFGTLTGNRLIGLLVKASSSGTEDPGFKSRLRQDFSGSSHTKLKNRHSSGYPARRMALKGQRLDWLAQCQHTVTGWDGKFDLQLLSQCGSMQNCLSRSIPEIHWHVDGTLSNQQTNKPWVACGHPQFEQHWLQRICCQQTGRQTSKHSRQQGAAWQGRSAERIEELSEHGQSWASRHWLLKGRGQHSTLQGWEWSAFNQTKTGLVLRATFRGPQRDGSKHVQAFPSATMSSWAGTGKLEVHTFTHIQRQTHITTVIQL